MKFCTAHWDALRKAINVRGLSDFVSADGKEAINREVGSLQGKKVTRANFDPLMSAHWTLVRNATAHIDAVGGNALAMLIPNPEHPEHRCPICYLNFLSDEHDRLCTDPACPKVKGLRFDGWIEKAADGCAEYVKTLPAE